MKLAATSLLLIYLGTPASAHRLDEYLQATTISLEQHRVQAQILLTPGVSVFPVVMAAIDTNRDGVIGTSEQRAYAGRVLGDLSLALDGAPLTLELISTNFPATDEMREGRGKIQIDFAARVPGDGPAHKLVFENRHLRPVSVYLVNCLMPLDADIHVTAQNRTQEQSLYQLNYVQSSLRSGPLSVALRSDGRIWFGFVGILLLARIGVLWRKSATSLGSVHRLVRPPTTH